jgi:FKBP-type peptidyl-prolyl cis-trans isomerase FklB
MKRLCIILLLCSCVMFAQKGKDPIAKTKAKTKTETKVGLNTQEEKTSYALGLNVASSVLNDIGKNNITISKEAFAKGFHDAFTGAKPALADSEIQAVMMAFQQQMQAKRQEMMNEFLAKQKKEGMDFLEANKKKDSVKVTESGLQYKILREGTGISPKDTNTVKVHYRGRLINGTVFDESYKRGEPAEFPLKGVIKGWTEGLQLLKVGGKAELYIPSDLAYGDNPSSRDIPPGATLIFEVELLDVK